MKSNVKSILFYVIILFFMAIYVQNARAVELPNPSPTDITNCHIYLGVGKSIPIHTISDSEKATTITNTFLTDGRRYKIVFSNPVPVTFNGITNIAYKLTSQNISTTPAPVNDYLWIYPELVFDDTARTLTKIATINIVFKSNTSGQWEKSKITEATADPRSLKLFGRYVKWLNDGNGDTKCIASSTDLGSDESVYTADPFLRTEDKKTAIIHKLKLDSSIESKWYFVARYNGSSLDYIYRNGESDNYIKVSENGQVNGTYTGSSSPTEWQVTSAEVSNFVPPQPIISRSEVYNHLKLPSDSGSKIQVKFDPALTDPPDVSGQVKKITLEIQLNNEHGAYTNKELININDQGTGTYKESDIRGIDNDIYILEMKDLDRLYNFEPSPPAEHKAALTKQVIVCAHKKLDQTGFSSGFEVLDMDGDNNSYWDDSGNIKKITDQDEGVKDWTAKTDPLTITATKRGTQKCGGDDDVDLTHRVAGAALDIGISMQNLILKALQNVATIIQNFIVYIVSWAIGLASQSVPI